MLEQPVIRRHQWGVRGGSNLLVPVWASCLAANGKGPLSAVTGSHCPELCTGAVGHYEYECSGPGLPAGSVLLARVVHWVISKVGACRLAGDSVLLLISGS